MILVMRRGGGGGVGAGGWRLCLWFSAGPDFQSTPGSPGACDCVRVKNVAYSCAFRAFVNKWQTADDTTRHVPLPTHDATAQSTLLAGNFRT